MSTIGDAPGGPGTPPTWSSSAKDAVTTALGSGRVWATAGYGIVNEVYWPSTGCPQIRDLGFIVAGEGVWHEVKRVRQYAVTTPKPYIPLPRIVHDGAAYQLELEVLPDPLRDVLLIRYRLQAHGLHLYVLLAPHLGSTGLENDARATEDLTATKAGLALCLAAAAGFSRTSAGFVGVSDGWQDFARNGAMTWRHARAANGNVALTGELAETDGVLALGFASTPEGARTLAHSSLAHGFEATRRSFIDGWERWARTLDIPEVDPAIERQALLSAMVLKVHEDRTFPGSLVASLSVPWGNSHDDLGGYHLVWPRDAVEAALALQAVGQTDDSRRMLAYLVATQSAEGCWPQNFFPDGRPYWHGVQLDEAAFPVILAARLHDAGAIDGDADVAAMVRRAVDYIVRNGPVSPQDRWEENPGANPFTLAVVVAALVAAQPFLDDADRAYALSLADCWNERIESWTYFEGGGFGAECGVDGYYVRIAPPASDGGLRGRVEIRNRPNEALPASALVGMDYLYLARMGLRQAADPRLRNTIAVTDHVLRVETPSGVSFHRYNDDGYGEHADGSPFDGTGIGRLWPLLTGERGHFALLAGDDATPYLEAMMRMTGPGGLMPEQIWDGAPVPARGLLPGKPSGSAMPLVWAHAEFLKLLVSKAKNRPVELLDAVQKRYGGQRPAAATWHWRDSSAFDALPDGRALSIERDEPFSLHYGFDGWHGTADRASRPAAFGMHVVRWAATELQRANNLEFTFYLPDQKRWIGTDWNIRLQAPS